MVKDDFTWILQFKDLHFTLLSYTEAIIKFNSLIRKVKKMKRISLIMASLMLISGLLAGCADNSGSKNTTDNTANANKEITVVSREEGSGTRGAFIELLSIEEKKDDGSKVDHTTAEALIANSTSVVLTQVTGNENAIGYISLGSLNDTVKAVKIDGVDATAENVKNGTYKVSRPFNIATKAEPTGLAKDFIDFILSADGQAVVGESYIKINDNAAPYTGTKPSGKIVVAGSSSVTPVMEKLAEAYEAVNPNAEIEIQMSDSSSGMKAVIDGTCDIGMASRELKDSEKTEIKNYLPIALDGIAVIVNNSNPVTDISGDTIKGIYTGEIIDWNSVR